MKIMFSAFAFAAVMAVGAGVLLNSQFQTTADARFVGSGAELRHSEAGSNLVGKTWNGMNRPGAN